MRGGRELGAAFGAVPDGGRERLAAAHAELRPGRVLRLAGRAHRAGPRGRGLLGGLCLLGLSLLGLRLLGLCLLGLCLLGPERAGQPEPGAEERPVGRAAALGHALASTECHLPGLPDVRRSARRAEQGQRLRVADVREHAFLVASHSIQYSFVRIKGLVNLLHGGNGMYIDRFVTAGYPGMLLHGNGDVLERTLRPGEKIMVEPGGFLYKDSTVQMEAVQTPLKTGFLRQGMYLAEMTGPGRVGIQSMYVHHHAD